MYVSIEKIVHSVSSSLNFDQPLASGVLIECVSRSSVLMESTLLGNPAICAIFISLKSSLEIGVAVDKYFKWLVWFHVLFFSGC